MDYAVTAKEILAKVGGEANVVSVAHCMTRLRVTLKDQSIVNDDQVKAIKGVVGVMKKGGQHQIIIGNEVAKCYKELLKLGKFSDEASRSTAAAAQSGSIASRIANGILDAISGSMSPVIPAILTAYAMSWIERGVDKITPAFTKNFLKPMLIILISCPIAFVILGPLGLIIGGFLSDILVFIQSHVSVLSYIIMAAAMPFIVMTGMHWAFIPVVFGALPPAGPEESLMLPAMLISNVGIAGSCLAVWLKSKNSETKQLGFSSGVSAALAGVTEPGLYGVVMPLKKPLIALIASNAITGLIAGIMHVAATSFASPSLLALPIFVNAERSSNFFMACACAAISIVLSFALTWVLGFEDRKE